MLSVNAPLSDDASFLVSNLPTSASQLPVLSDYGRQELCSKDRIAVEQGQQNEIGAIPLLYMHMSCMQACSDITSVFLSKLSSNCSSANVPTYRLGPALACVLSRHEAVSAGSLVVRLGMRDCSRDQQLRHCATVPSPGAQRSRDSTTISTSSHRAASWECRLASARTAWTATNPHAAAPGRADARVLATWTQAARQRPNSGRDHRSAR